MPRLRKSGVMSSLSPTRRRLGAGLGRTVVSARKMAAMERAIEAPEIVLRAEKIAEMSVTGVTRVVVRLAIRMTRTADSLPRTGVGATAVLRRLLGFPGPLRKEAMHRVLL